MIRGGYIASDQRAQGTFLDVCCSFSRCRAFTLGQRRTGRADACLSVLTSALPARDALSELVQELETYRV